jgi:hypothetical protein
MNMLTKIALLSGKYKKIGYLSFEKVTYKNLQFCGMDGTRTRDLLRDRQAF